MKITIIEGFKDDMTPSMKYYAFDWDDNIVHMPTKIILKTEDGEEVGMGTDEFAKYREKIGKTPFVYNGDVIVGFGENAFKNFRTEGDKQFLIDAMKAKEGPAFNDFREAINNGSIFAIVTARGHNPNTLKQAVYNYIVSNFNGINKDELVKNLRKYRKFTDEEDMSDNELIKNYLELNKYHPVTFGNADSAASPEELKVMAMDEFISYVKELSSYLNKKAYLKNDINNNFIPSAPSIGFSDDDLKNVEVMGKHFKNKPEKDILNTYYTGTGSKTRLD